MLLKSNVLKKFVRIYTIANRFDSLKCLDLSSLVKFNFINRYLIVVTYLNLLKQKINP